MFVILGKNMITATDEGNLSVLGNRQKKQNEEFNHSTLDMLLRYIIIELVYYFNLFF